MNISERMQKAFNEQIKHELNSSYLYLAMSAYFDGEGWEGMAKWMRKQSTEEDHHAMRIYHHIADRGGRVYFTELPKPQAEWSSPLAAWRAALEHERFITSKIHELVKVANEEKDYSATPLLNWFLEEQIEEEEQTAKVVQALEHIGDSKNAMFMLDAHLGKRTE